MNNFDSDDAQKALATAIIFGALFASLCIVLMAVVLDGELMGYIESVMYFKNAN